MKKKQNLIVITTIIAILASLTAIYFVGPASALVDFDAYKGAAISDAQIDGTIGTEWNDAGNYTSVAVDPQGTAEVWTKHDGTYLYIAIRFTADSNNPWVAFQLGTTGCMDASADVAIFGNDNLASDEYSDAYISGFSVVADTSQDGIGAMDIGTDNTVTIELKKPLNSGDSNGNDITWTEGDTYTLVVAWDSDGGGSNGGSANHRSSGPTPRSILIDPNPKTPVTPENDPPVADFDYTITELTVKFIDYSLDTDGTITSWLWKFGDGTTVANETNPMHTYSEMGKYTVALTVTDDKGSTDTTSKTFMVPSAEQRMQLWITQVAIIAIAIGFVSFIAVGIALKIEAKKEGKKHGHT